MKLTGDKPKDKVNQLTSLLPIGKQVMVSFSKHTDVAKLISCSLATQASIKALGGNVPNKRRGEDGKDYTSACATLHFNNSTDYYFNIVLDDIDYSLGVGKIIIKVPSATITIKEI